MNSLKKKRFIIKNGLELHCCYLHPEIKETRAEATERKTNKKSNNNQNNLGSKLMKQE